MKQYLEMLEKTPLFHGINSNEIEGMMNCLDAVKKSYVKNEVILAAGEPVTHLGILLSGRGQIMREDLMGNRTILSNLECSDMFAEAFACSPKLRLPFRVIAITECEILFLDYGRIVRTCPSACNFHATLIRNMMQIFANKNILLTQKMEHITKRSTREKLLSYLSEQAEQSSSKVFTIPFNRQELADFLCVDRSAMSNELSKLREEKIIDFERSDFRLY